jgi:O-methyltransferase involved in polyketide biosynthesis
MLEKGKITIELGSVQETLLMPLWARAREAEKENPIVCDNYARNIVKRIEYDFSKLDALLTDEMHQMSFPIRAYNFDSIVMAFLEQNRKAVVVNIGAGLDTTFQRVDNGKVLWINIDLPDVVALRQKLIPDSKREITIDKSVFDFTWMNDIARKTRDCSIMFMAAGVFCYFEVSDIKNLFRKLADLYPSSHVVFDSFQWFTVWAWNMGVRMGKAHLSALMKWHLKRASHLKKWVDTIKVVEDYPMFAKVKFRNDWSRKVIRGMKVTNMLRLYNMVHVQL